jgi:hypothetical protein
MIARQSAGWRSVDAGHDALAGLLRDAFGGPVDGNDLMLRARPRASIPDLGEAAGFAGCQSHSSMMAKEGKSLLGRNLPPRLIVSMRSMPLEPPRLRPRARGSRQIRHSARELQIRQHARVGWLDRL